jgi:type IV secretory pathway VirB4 component
MSLDITKTYKTLFSDLRKTEQNLSNILLYYDFIDNENTGFEPVLMKDGSIIVLFSLEGMDYEGLSEQERDQLSYYIKGACEQLGSGYTLENYMIRRPASFIALKETGKSPEIIQYIQEKKEDFWREICTNSLENELLFCLRYFKAKKKERPFSAMISENKQFEIEQKEIESSLNKLYQGYLSFRSSIQAVSIGPGQEKFEFKSLDRKQTFRAIYKLVNFCEPGPYRSDLSLNTQVAHARYEFGKKYVRINENLFMRAISVKYPPPSTCAFYLRRFFDLPKPFIMRQSFGFINFETFEKKMLFNRNIAMSLSSIDKASEKYVAEVSGFQDKVKSDKQIPAYWKYYIYVMGETAEACEKNSFAIIALLKELGSFGLQEVGNLRNAIFSMFPGHSRLSARKAVLLSSNAGDLLCCYSLFKGDKQPIEYFLDRNNGIYSYHPFTQRENAHHMLISGPTGGGKSFMCNKLLISSLVENPFIYVIDLSKSFNPFFELLKEHLPTETSIMEISNEKIDFQFNPFLLDDFDKPVQEEQINFCEGLLTLMIGHKVIDDSNRIVIRETLIQFFQEYASLLRNLRGEPAPPPLDIIISILESRAPSKAIPNSLKLWTYGRKGKLFNTGIDSLKRSRYILFDLEDLCSKPESSDELVAVIFTIFNKIYADISNENQKSERKLLFLDEAHRYLLQPEFSYWIQHLFRVGRHFNLLVGVITQSINDLFSAAEWSKGIITNLKQAILFNGQKDVNDAFTKLGMTDYHCNEYAKMKPQRREFFYWTASGLRRILSPITDPFSYWLATTDPAERKMRKVFEKINGNDMKKTIFELVRLTAGNTTSRERIDILKRHVVKNNFEMAKLFNLGDLK